MDFQFTEEQKMLKSVTRDFMEKEIIPRVDEYEEKYEPLPREELLRLMKELAPLGYLGTVIPREYGGEGLDCISYGVLLEELARAWGSLGFTIWVHQLVGPWVYLNLGSKEQKKKYIPPAVAGEKICGYGLTEPNVGSGLMDIETTAVLDGNHYIINGTKTWLSNGSVADYIILYLYTDKSKGAHGGTSIIMVDRGESSFTAKDIHKIGLRCSPTSEVIFADCRVPKENLLGEEGEGYKLSLGSFLLFRPSFGMCGVGLSQAAIDASIKYAQERIQFGRPIGKFQMVQGMIADMVMETEASRLLTYEALSLMDRGEAPFKEASMCKVFSTEAAFRVTHKAVEIHGAYGLSKDYPVERYFRDATTLIPPDGTSQIQRLILARETLGMSAFV